MTVRDFLKSLTGLSVLALGLASSAQADALSDIKARGTLICGVLGTSQPYGYLDPTTKESIGYEVDLCRMAAEYLGVKAEVKVTSSEARIPELMQGRVDFLAALISYSAARAEQVDFSNSYLRESFGFLAAEDIGATKLDDLDGQRLAINKGNFMEPLIATRLPKASIVAFEEQPVAFMAVQQGKAAAVAGRFTSLLVLQMRAGNEGRSMVIIQEPLVTQSTGFVVRKGEDALRSELNAFLDQLEASGEAQKLYDKWLGKDSDFGLTRNFKAGDPVDQ
ncbi:MAG: transporter substrate-binding domain-containing protein [Rhodobacteraceae bacterium]|nr:transporter substrate-binding domain-containing protein [Paracoccaceae bacterium]